MRLLLIRHGQTPNNVSGALDTAIPGAGLTSLGHTQAAAVPSALDTEQIAGVYASRLTRTQLTAAPLAQARGLQVRVTPGLEEISAGMLEMRSDSDSVRGYVECLANWLHGDLGHSLPGGMTGHEFWESYDGAVRALAAGHEQESTLAVFSHGAAIRVYAALATGLRPGVADDLWLANTGMGVLEGDPDAGWRLAHWNSTPLGGAELMDLRAHDVTGESTEEVEAETS